VRSAPLHAKPTHHLHRAPRVPSRDRLRGHQHNVSRAPEVLPAPRAQHASRDASAPAGPRLMSALGAARAPRRLRGLHRGRARASRARAGRRGRVRPMRLWTGWIRRARALIRRRRARRTRVCASLYNSQNPAHGHRHIVARRAARSSPCAQYLAQVCRPAGQLTRAEADATQLRRARRAQSFAYSSSAGHSSCATTRARSRTAQDTPMRQDSRRTLPWSPCVTRSTRARLNYLLPAHPYTHALPPPVQATLLAERQL
jgi:hypothetical protein